MKRARKLEKPIYDMWGDVVEVDRLPYIPTRQEQDEIRRVLKMHLAAPWPRCRYRDIRKARELDRKLGFTRDQMKANLGVHTKSKHVCADCRCRSVAGSGTRGWWFWRRDNKWDWKEAGHYGVGPCYNHSPHHMEGGWPLVQSKYREMVIREIEAMQEYGSAPDTNGAYLVRFKSSEKNAVARNDIRSSLEMVKTLVNELIEKLRAEREQAANGSDRQANFILGLHELYDGEHDEHFDGKVWDYVQRSRPLTESGGKGKAMPITDNTAYKLLLAFLRTVALIAKGDFDVSKGDYAHVDVITVFVQKCLTAADMRFKALVPRSVWEEFGGDFKGILKSMVAADDTALFTERVM